MDKVYERDSKGWDNMYERQYARRQDWKWRPPPIRKWKKQLNSQNRDLKK